MLMASQHMASLAQKVQEIENDEYITRVEQPTKCVHSMVVSVKGDKVIICIDSCDMNQAMRREHHPMETKSLHSTFLIKKSYMLQHIHCEI